VLKSDKLEIPLSWNSPDGIKIQKTYTFWQGKHLVDVAYRVQNQSKKDWIGHFYGQILQKPEAKSSSWGMQTYYGGAVYTPKKPYKQISFDKMREKPFEQDITGGWAAIAQHYFLTAWVFPVHEEFKYFAKGVAKGRVSIGAVGDAVLIKPGEEKSLNASLYIGPEDADVLKTISPGLDLTVDYGFLWPISKFLFWVMKQLHALIGNWGWVIIAITVIIKLAFYKLSASSYHSMGKMRQIQPQLTLIKERCGDDKQRFSQEMLELYRNEKVNPLGGCLPILIQIPVFIALYYVLLENVEFRHAPFMFWVQDLSSKDPFYVLPLLMGVTMIIQQKLSPPPPDPIQAKVMMLMPIFFTVLFLQFPAGLTLYWFVNNLLSITQQWVILKRMN
jgi:YidC/Oxa1 family membrane protein insertase